MLLEKKIILIKTEINDVAIIIQTLITLIQPFKWNFGLINNLPSDMIEALESPQPFIVGIQRKLWDSDCKV